MKLIRKQHPPIHLPLLQQSLAPQPPHKSLPHPLFHPPCKRIPPYTLQTLTEKLLRVLFFWAVAFHHVYALLVIPLFEQEVDRALCGGEEGAESGVGGAGFEVSDDDRGVAVGNPEFADFPEAARELHEASSGAFPGVEDPGCFDFALGGK